MFSNLKYLKKKFKNSKKKFNWKYFFNLKYFPPREGLTSEFKIAFTFLHPLEIKTHCCYLFLHFFIFLYVFTFPPLHCQHKPLLSTSLDPHRTLNIQAEFTWHGWGQHWEINAFFFFKKMKKGKKTRFLRRFKKEKTSLCSPALSKTLVASPLILCHLSEGLDSNQRWGNSDLMTKYEYEYYSAFQK